jgi:beta-glucosidase
VLLQNNNSVLPVTSSTNSIAVIGDDAGQNAMTAGNGSAHVNAPYVVTPYQGIASRAGSGTKVTYSQGYSSPNGEIVDGSYLTPSQGSGSGLYAQYYNGNSLSGNPLASGVAPNVNYNWGGLSPTSGVPADNWSAKYTGTITPPTTGTYTFSLTSDDGSRLFVNGQQVISNWADQPATTKTGTISLTAGQPVSIEVDYFQDGGGSQLNLGWQVPNQNLDGDAVTAAKAAQMAIVFVDNAEGEGADLNNIDLASAQNQLVSDVAAANPNTVVVVNSGSAVTMPWANSVRGIIENWYPGQEDGNAIAALLYGDVDFSGKLPVTFPQSLAQVPASTPAQWPGQNGQVQYSEGVDVGYRYYDSQHETPLFPFGFGLSYTSFGFSGLNMSPPDANGNVTVGFTVTNTGKVAGSEVAQVYVGEPSSTGEPPNSLRGFQRVTLNPGQSQQVSVVLNGQSFQYWNNGWVNAAGANTISVGSSSRDLPLTGTVTIGSGGTQPPPPPNTNLALGKTITASGYTQVYGPGNANDNNTNSYWESTDNAFPQWLQVDLGSSSTVGRIVLTLPPSTAWGTRTETLSVQCSADGTNFSTLVGSAGYTFDPSSGNTVTITVPSTNSRYLRLNVTGNTGWPAGQVSEFEVFSS